MLLNDADVWLLKKWWLYCMDTDSCYVDEKMPGWWDIDDNKDVNEEMLIWQSYDWCHWWSGGC